MMILKESEECQRHKLINIWMLVSLTPDQPRQWITLRLTEQMNLHLSQKQRKQWELKAEAVLETCTSLINLGMMTHMELASLSMNRVLRLGKLTEESWLIKMLMNMQIQVNTDTWIKACRSQDQATKDKLEVVWDNPRWAKAPWSHLLEVLLVLEIKRFCPHRSNQLQQLAQQEQGELKCLIRRLPALGNDFDINRFNQVKLILSWNNHLDLW